jgi:hypothetical protein
MEIRTDRIAPQAQITPMTPAVSPSRGVSIPILVEQVRNTMPYLFAEESKGFEAPTGRSATRTISWFA